MLCDHTTLANVPRLLAQTLRDDYAIDPMPLLHEAGIDPAAFMQPGARVAFSKMTQLWELAVQATGDRLFGFQVGSHLVPSDFYVLGYSWMASGTLYDALERLCRYVRVVSSAISTLQLEESDEAVAVVEVYRDRSVVPHRAASDGGYVALIKLCESIMRRRVRAISVELTVPPDDANSAYGKLFGCPVVFGAAGDKIFFSRSDMEQTLPGSLPEILDASDTVADRYLQSMDMQTVAARVRQQIVQMLPSGHTDQETVAGHLHRSRATLQRQLSAEGTSFRKILVSTRKSLAIQYLRDGSHSQAEIAFLTGFTDQSNFARAFKRWSGVTPGHYLQDADTTTEATE